MSRGIDYGRGQTNIDHETGIRYGVIPQNDVLQSWSDASEADYGPAACGECGNEAVAIEEVPFNLDDCKTLRRDKRSPYSIRECDILRIPKEHRAACGDNKEWRDEGRDYACLHCGRSFDSDDAFSDEPVYGFNLDDGEYVAHQAHDDPDIFVLKSPYYTNGPFCSPCAPGAVYLRDAIDDVNLEVGAVYGRDKMAGAPAYCFAPDWFDYWREDGVEPAGHYLGEPTSCPYAVFRVSDNVCIYRPGPDPKTTIPEGVTMTY